MNNNTDREVVYIHGPRGVTTETYPTVSDGEAYPLFPMPFPGNGILELYSVDHFNNEVDPFSLVIDCDENGYNMQLTALDVVNHNPIFNGCIYFGVSEVNIDDVTIIDDLNNVLGKLNEKIHLNHIPVSIKLQSKDGGIVRLKTHIIKF